MAGTIQRSGFSKPENANLTAALAAPSAPVDFEIYSWGVQATDEPNELAKIVFRWKTPSTRDLTISNAASDDVYTAFAVAGVTSGTYSANDTVISLAAAPAVPLVNGDKIQIGLDPTRYTVASATGGDITILYGLLYPQVSSGAAVTLLQRTGESTALFRQLRVDARTGDSVTVEGSYDFDYRLGWVASASLGEWEDLDKYLVTLSPASLSYYVRDSGEAAAAAADIGSQLIAVTGDLTALLIPTVSRVSFGNKPGLLYTVAAVSSSAVVLLSAAGLTENVSAGDALWIEQLTPFLGYDSIDVGQLRATKILPDSELGGFRLYYSSAPIASSLIGATLEATIPKNDARVVENTDGYWYYTWWASSASYDGRKIYWALTAYDSSVPANVSAPDLNAWVITYPGQASISSATSSGTSRTVTYANLTAGGANPHLYDMMNGAFMTQYSTDGGYDLYRYNYLPLLGGSYVGVSTSSGRYLNSTIEIGDIVVVYDSGTGDEWSNVCAVKGQITLTDSVLTYSASGSGQPYSGLNSKHLTANITAKFGRINRTTDSVLPLTAFGEKQYLTDYQSTHVVTLIADTDQGISIESVDTRIEAGKL